eukprot:618941-Amphidinium_carterae.1
MSPVCKQCHAAVCLTIHLKGAYFSGTPEGLFERSAEQSGGWGLRSLLTSSTVLHAHERVHP